MMEWLVDNATGFYVVLACIGLALAVGWWSSRGRGLLIGLLVVAGLAGLLYLLTVVVVTDRRQLTDMVREMASAVSNNEPDRIVRHLSKDFDAHGLTKAKAPQYVSNLTRTHKLQDVYVWDFDVEKLSPPPVGKAAITFLARVEFGGGGMHVFRCRLYCVHQDGHWRVRGFDIFNPVVSHDQPIQLP